MNPVTPATDWLERQYRHAARQMLHGISSDVVMPRPGFGVSVRAAPGSIVASVVPGYYDPEPDYFFHWYRDAAVVIDALRVLHLGDPADPQPAKRFGEFLQFSLDTLGPVTRRRVERPGWRDGVQPRFRQYLRTDPELARVRDPMSLRGETRLNADGTLDFTGWPRPQHDGIATRALALRRWLQVPGLAPGHKAAAQTLLDGDLDYVRAHWDQPCHDIWEEESGLHYYTLLAAAAALGGRERHAILRRLDDYWDPRLGCYRSRVLADGGWSPRDPDISVLLAAIHCDLDGPAHSVADPRQQATLQRLEQVFERAFAINRGRPAGHAPALGRYETDAYFGGGAWYVATLGAAQFCYRAAAGASSSRPGAAGMRSAADWVAHGDAFLATVQRFTPPGGDMAEQFDRNTGEPRSARHLTWSYAAFITCAAARRDALARQPAM